MTEPFDWMRDVLLVPADGHGLMIALMITSLAFYLPLCMLRPPRRASPASGDPLAGEFSAEALHRRISGGHAAMHDIDRASAPAA